MAGGWPIGRSGFDFARHEWIRLRSPREDAAPQTSTAFDRRQIQLRSREKGPPTRLFHEGVPQRITQEGDETCNDKRDEHEAFLTIRE
jgi:hypothetical protein